MVRMVMRIKCVMVRMMMSMWMGSWVVRIAEMRGSRRVGMFRFGIVKMLTKLKG